MTVKHWLLCAACSLAATAVPAAETPPAAGSPTPPPSGQLPTGTAAEEWAHQAIADLAKRGLVHGYKDAKFLEGRKLTRYEMASLIKRVIDSLLETPAPEPGKGPVSEAPGTAASRGQGLEPPPPARPLPGRGPSRSAAFLESDLPVIRQLADVYSVELAVIGVNLQDAMERLAALEGRLEAVEKTVNDPKGPLQKAVSDIARLDRIRFSGYVQGRYESFEKTREADPPGTRVPVTNRFSLRRVRMTLNARPTSRVYIKWELEGNAPGIESRDAFISYYLRGNPATGYTVSFGQMKVPFGFEIPQSSGARETLERARVIRFFYPSERDRGVKVSSPTGKRWFYELGVYNGVIGPGTPAIGLNDNNNEKDVVGRIRTTQFGGKVDAGVSFHFGESSRTALFRGEQPRGNRPPSPENPYDNTRITLGADLQWHIRKGTEFRAEALWGKARGSRASGYILQFLQDLNPKNQFVLRYDWLGIDGIAPAPLGGGGTPVGDSVPYEGTLSNLAIGIIHRLDPAVRLKLFYEIHSIGRERIGGDRVPWQGNMLRFEVLTLF